MDNRNLMKRWEAGLDSGLPAPWQKCPLFHVGGVTEVGLSSDGQYLLVISYHGRGVFDCRTGIKVARDRDETFDAWLDAEQGLAQGIGPLAGQNIPIVGGFVGSALPAATQDGWRLERLDIESKMELVWATPPGEKDGFLSGGCYYKLWDWDPVFAAGFSQNGATCVIACSNTIDIWSR
ncbi:MAG: hypothetical protein KDE59_26915 [Anaerolineales bacterium]|nr:hypothetical protein [Anaerolineales bacterium]